MNNIQITYPKTDFDFNELILSQPTVITGGTYLTKILHMNKPLYLQIPKCKTKQGFVKHKKKISCDLLLNNLNEELIGWFENLDNRCKDIFIQKSLEWFSTPLEKDDIDTLFTPTLKLYRSGKFSLVKTNIKMNNSNDHPLITIYDESQQPVSIESVTSDTNLIVILEIVGIKFTSRNFALEVEIKQAMTVTEVEEDIEFKKCLIQPIAPIHFRSNIKPELYIDTNGTLDDAVNHIEFLSHHKINSKETEETEESISKENTLTKTIPNNNNNLVNIDETINTIESNNEYKDTYLQDQKLNSIVENIKEQSSDNIEFITLTKPCYTDEIVPLDDVEEILVDNPNDMLELHKPEDIYYQLYKTAKQKAKEALLEVKRIKQQYNIYTSDEDTEDDSYVESSDDEIEDMEEI
jgi:hypothetical protein